MANVNFTVDRIAPVGGANSKGHKQGVIVSAVKVAQNDTITFPDVSQVLHVNLVIVATGVAEPATISGNVITLTSATAGPVRGIITYI